MRVVVVGAGAIGSAYAWLLARAGHDVAIVDVRRDHVEAVARDGLVAVLPDGEQAVRVAATTEPEALAPAEFVLVATKSFSTREAAARMGPLLRPRTLVATVQNGLGNDRALADVLGPRVVLPGSTTVAAEPAGPGRVRISKATLASGSTTSLGPPRDAPELLGDVRRLCEELTAAGLPAEALPDVDVVVWRKLALAGSMAPLSAVLGFTIADVIENPAATALLRRLVEEIVAVARATGVDLDLDETWALALATYGSVGPHRASMAVDVAERRPTEIDAMCVEVARLGREHGVPAPVNEVVGELVRAIEHHSGARARPAPEALLAAAASG